MSIRGFRASRRAAGILMAALAFAAMAPAPQASAQGLFETLFGGMRRPTLPPQTNSFVDPLGGVGTERPRATGGEYAGGSGTYCVRTCDGRFFPMQRNSSASPAELCRAFCPASKTMVFSGGKIDHAVASNGTRYSDLENAFVYREKVVDSCTCNGKDPFGLARVDLETDPTLKAGDIVATNDGLATFRGKTGGRTAEFTPISASSSAWAKRLSEVQVRPQPAQQKIEPVAEEATAVRKFRRGVQASR